MTFKDLKRNDECRIMEYCHFLWLLPTGQSTFPTFNRALCFPAPRNQMTEDRNQTTKALRPAPFTFNLTPYTFYPTHSPATRFRPIRFNQSEIRNLQSAIEKPATRNQISIYPICSIRNPKSEIRNRGSRLHQP
jgi:hypothetical protein